MGLGFWVWGLGLKFTESRGSSSMRGSAAKREEREARRQDGLRFCPLQAEVAVRL